MAANVTYIPWTYIGAAGDCGTGYPAGTPNGANAQQNSNGSVTLTKSAPTPDCSSAGVTLNNVAGINVTSLSFDYSGYCGAGAPRFNVYTTSGVLFFGCTYGDPSNTGTVTFTAGNTYGGVNFPSGGVTVKGIEIVQDETGTVTLQNIFVNGNTVTYANVPNAKDQCKDNGYKNLTDLNGHSFKNQGQCVSYLEHVTHMSH